MQGVVFMPQNPQQGSPPPNNTFAPNMEVSPSPMVHKKKQETSSRSDSGIFSSTNNSSTTEHTDAMSHTSSGSENEDDIQENDIKESSLPDNKKYRCPICSESLSSQHEFTIHIKNHNTDGDIQQDQESTKGYTCRICFKVLSSSSSLDRHVLVHSGERPFHCKYCGDTFTTNGNMHRHMRTHSQKLKNYESDGSSDGSSSGKSSTEYNNNKIERHNKRKLDVDEHPPKKRHFKEPLKCPVCERSDFDSLAVLESHLEDNHPDYPAKCHQCNAIFSNLKQLEVHRSMIHDIHSNKHLVVGFKDLTFVDFSSKKFPQIARYECEKNLHKASGGLKFQCNKCNRSFPCSNSLEFHEKECSKNVGLDFSTPKVSEQEVRRSDFFSRLNLLDNSPEKQNNSKFTESKQLIPADSSKDLADIQTIISMTTNGGLLSQLPNKIDISNLPKHNELSDSKHEEEEIQDAFAVEFRKMKLRGEFPCRLCTAIFPNLRALKGHNRAHLNGNNNGTYRCNMCPHSSIDKAALIRHMRTHNGDRPYECSLCNYAFTTKANCERHLRNRHAKTTREEVKKSIIYHPSEDPTNDDINKLVGKEDSKKLLVENEITTPEKMHFPKMPEIRPISELKLFGPDVNPLLMNNNLQVLKESLNLSIPKDPNVYNVNNSIKNDNLKSLKEFRTGSLPIPSYFPPQFPFNPSLNNTSTPRSIAHKLPEQYLKTAKNSSYDDHSDEEYEENEEPLDLVLDLSTKKKLKNEAETPVDIPEDLSTKNSTPNNLSEMFPHPSLIRGAANIDPAAFYTQWALLRNGFAGMPAWPGFPINPLFFQTLQPPVSPSAVQDMKERLRNQLCGGSLISENRMAMFNQAQNPNVASNLLKDIRAEEFTKKSFALQKKIDDMKPLSLNLDQNINDNISKMPSPIAQQKNDISQSPNSVKMVIKNGILMPKQKQRRYRTERPFTCEHCSARFTLRSNMERHIKQQHPQYWSQRQRGNVGNPGRRNQNVTPKSSYCDLSIPNYELPKNEDYEETKDTINEKLKYAILAQHLRNANNNFNHSIKKEEEEEDALIIDEKNDDDVQLRNRGILERNQSVLEGRLREYKANQASLEPKSKFEESQDLVPVSRLLDNASQQPFKEYFKREGDEHDIGVGSEEDEEGLVASGSTSEGNISGTDENRSEMENTAPVKKKSAYSLAPNRVSCPYCSRKFPWTSSLRRHILTHTGQKPFKCSHCPLLFTTKSNCDRHLLRKHGNAATTIANETINQNNSSNFLMRNVPERPFKCSNCPSSTFSTYSNLKKHISCKHSTNAQGDDIKAQGYEAGSSEDEKAVADIPRSEWEVARNNNDLSGNNNANLDQPFKCHLCESSFSERQDALDHIKDKHPSEYELLMSKNALDNNATTPEDVINSQNDDDDQDIRGKFPDYSNRKVICAFCMRRFWSAEDLRRHMRTHTGERPFSCDICRRRFTLKHSMLRHRKKHNINFDGDLAPNSDEDIANGNNGIKSEKTDESDQDGAVCSGDLISNLLGIRPSFIDKVLTASPDDAAKLLGVNNRTS